MHIQISTRIKVVIVTFLSFVVFLLTQLNVVRVFESNSLLTQRVGDSLIISIIVFVGVLWITGVKLNKIKVLIIPFFPSLFVFLYTLFFRLSTLEGFLGLTNAAIAIIANLLFIFFIYALILNVNILNIADDELIPLARAAKTAQYIFSLIVNYLFFTLIINISIPNSLRLILTLLFLLYLSFQLLWVLSLSSNFNIKLTIPIALVIFLISLSLNLWPTLSEMVSLLLTIVYYVIFGVALETSPKFSKAVIFEYSFVTLLILFFFFLITDWGINGRIIG